MPKPTKRLTAVRDELFVSAVLLADKYCGGLAHQVEMLGEILAERYLNYEILVIDNFAPPRELEKLRLLLSSVSCIRIVRLSKGVSRDTAAFAGLESAIGDFVVLMIAGQDPVKLLPKFVERNRRSDMVLGCSRRQLRQGLLNRYGADLFYWYNKKYLGIDIPPNSTYFMSLNRQAVNAATRSGRYARHIRYMTRQIGYSSSQLMYTPLRNAKVEKKHAGELLVSALELISSYSKHPLRFLSWLGLAGAAINLVYGIYVVSVKIFGHHVAEGWTTLSLQSAVMFFFLFLILALLSEYIGQILEESRDEVSYHVMDELTSKVGLATASRRNIVK